MTDVSVSEKPSPSLLDVLRSENAFQGLLWLIIGFGVLARSLGYFDGSNSLWHDEVVWFRKLTTEPLTDNYFRPIGYMALSRVCVSIATNEVMLRLVSYVSSILTLVVAGQLLPRLFRSKVVIAVSLILLAMNPIAVEAAKEFKPYGVEPLFHLLLNWVLLIYLKTPRMKLEIGILLLCGISLFFAYNIVFLVPSAFAVILLTHKDQINRKTVFLVGGAGLLVLMVMLILNQLIWQLTPASVSHNRTYWGEKYGVFYLGHSLVDHIRWIGQRFYGMLSYTGHLKAIVRLPPFMIQVKSVLLLAGTLLAFGFMIKKKQAAIFLLLVAPILLVILANVLGFWPFGAFRSNVFLFSYLIFTAGYGFDQLLLIGRNPASAPRSPDSCSWCSWPCNGPSIFSMAPRGSGPTRPPCGRPCWKSCRWKRSGMEE